MGDLTLSLGLRRASRRVLVLRFLPLLVQTHEGGKVMALTRGRHVAGKEEVSKDSLPFVTQRYLCCVAGTV